MLVMNGNLTKGKLLLLLEIYMIKSQVLWHEGIIFLISWAITSDSNHFQLILAFDSRQKQIRPGMNIIPIF